MSAPTLDAQLDGWVREVHQEQVWGTVVTFDVRDESLDRGARVAIDGAVAFLHQVDAWFSTYRMDTPITALRMGLVGIECVATGGGTDVTVSYDMTALSERGEQSLAAYEGDAYARMIDGWALSIAQRLPELLAARIR